jgi:cephalosporin hydroxylase
LVDFAFTGCYGIIKPSQVQNEILELLKILSGTKPKFILEIGTANGGTLFLFSRVASQSATMISVDLPGGPFGGGYPESRIPLYKSFALPNQQIHLIRANSHDRGTLEQVKAVLGGEQIDFLFIDGDHSYEGVKMDFEMYSRLVKKGGLMAFHDIVVGAPESVGEVNRFWNEIKRKYESVEIVENSDQNGWGIGWLLMK